MSTTVNKASKKSSHIKQSFFQKKLVLSVWTSRREILATCAIGAIIGLVIIYSTPSEYRASTLIVPESTRNKSSYSGINAWANITGTTSSAFVDRDAIYPTLYPRIIKSTPFLIQLFDIKVRPQADSTTITLSQYLKEHQKYPWWKVITSAPYKLLSITMSLFKTTSPKDILKPDTTATTRHATSGPLYLTREEARKAGAIAARIGVGVDKDKRTITIFATMQDPLVAATVVDSLSVRLRQYITQYRTDKARRILKYNEELCQEAQEAYYAAQDRYTQFADSNQNLVLLTARAQRATLRYEMELAYASYDKMEKQVQASKARVEKERPVYAVIEPATVPLSPSKPRKALILAGCILLSAIGSIGWVLFGQKIVSILKRIVQQPQPHKKRRDD